MRLSIQHFQRLLENNPDEAMQKSKSLVNSLIEQIDNLTQIANEFSRFAKISVSSRSTFDLKKQMLDISGLFSTDENVSVKTKIDLKEEIVKLINL